MDHEQKDGSNPARGPQPESPNDRLDWTTPKLISEEVTSVTRGGTGFTIPPDRGTLYSS